MAACLEKLDLDEDEELEVKTPKISHPIIASIKDDIVKDAYACNCDDYEVCEYEAGD